MLRTPAVIVSIVLLCLPALPVFPCHVPEKLRAHSGELGATELAFLSQGHAAQEEEIPYKLAAPTPCVGGMADIFPCSNISLLAVLQLPDIGGGRGSDIWGWRDPLTGKEYALFGRSNGTAFIDISDPENPIYVGNLPTQTSSSTWRDIKVYADYAFVVADFNGDHGMQVFDLTQLRTVTTPPATFSNSAHYDGFERAHNLVINEDTGFIYATGSESCSGGLHMINVQDPLNPSFAGCYSDDGYSHDAQCVVYNGPDVAHQGKEICFNSNEDTVTIVDVTTKSNPIMLSRTGYTGSGYTHQGWLTEDQTQFVHDDEGDERTFGHNTRTYIWNVSDLDNPTIAGTYTATGAAIDHNQYVHGDYTYQANYRRGLRVLSVREAARGQLTEVAYLDTYPEGDGNDFSGAWSTYPFFDSGVVIVSDVNRGLFIVRAEIGVFADDFESGATDAWDVAVP